jgi:CDP-6-deoxy-D-xylo-4-hexulose-3-dehydrase
VGNWANFKISEVMKGHIVSLEDGEAFGLLAVVISEADSNGFVEVLPVESKRIEDTTEINKEDLVQGSIEGPLYVITSRPTTTEASRVIAKIGVISNRKIGEIHKSMALRHTKAFSEAVHGANRPSYLEKQSRLSEFIPGVTPVPYAARVFDGNEVVSAVHSAMDFWLTLGEEGAAFEEEFQRFLNIKNTVLVNSGSSANLLALSALTSHKLGDRRIKKGDEVITAAAAFPTTVAPILQIGAIPVFVDSDPATLNVKTEHLEEAFNPGKTKAVMMAHTLGNPFNLSATIDFCERHGLWLIEDNCDSLGSTYDGRYTGSFGDLSTQSFYPAHHLTMGEGGAVNVVREEKLTTIVQSLRDWGRDCWCPSGKDNTCNKRFGWKLGELPFGYDHKYIYSHIGFNLKPLDLQAAIGREQLKKLPDFIEVRKRNWNYLREGLAPLEGLLGFTLPTHAKEWTKEGFNWDDTGHRTECSWFGFGFLVNPRAPFTRTELATHLDSRKIGNRMLFGGNLVRQPAFVELKKIDINAFRIAGSLDGANRIMNDCIFLGTYPGLSERMLDYVIDTITKFCNR